MKSKQKTKKQSKPSKPKSQKKEYKLFTNPPEPVTRESLMKWLSDSGWVEGRIGRVISPLDRPYFEDYVQEVWVQILSVPEDKIMDIWYRGKGKFVNYIKAIIVNNVRSTSSNLYNHIRKGGTIERLLTDEQWNALESTGESEYDVTFCINDFDPETRNRSVHYGYDKESCKLVDEKYMMEEDKYDLDEDGDI